MNEFIVYISVKKIEKLNLTFYLCQSVLIVYSNMQDKSRLDGWCLSFNLLISKIGLKKTWFYSFHEKIYELK